MTKEKQTNETTNEKENETNNENSFIAVRGVGVRSWLIENTETEQGLKGFIESIAKTEKKVYAISIKDFNSRFYLGVKSHKYPEIPPKQQIKKVCKLLNLNNSIALGTIKGEMALKITLQ